MRTCGGGNTNPCQDVCVCLVAVTHRSCPDREGAGATPTKPFVQAQRYVSDPLLIHGRKFGLRVWVLVCGCDPMRAYLHTNGLVLFATDQ